MWKHVSVPFDFPFPEQRQDRAFVSQGLILRDDAQYTISRSAAQMVPHPNNDLTSQ
jgi:hypothetical protein